MDEHSIVDCDVDQLVEIAGGDTSSVTTLAMVLIQHGPTCWAFTSLAALHRPEAVLQAYTWAVEYFRRAA